MCSKCFFNDEILNVIVHETNRYASQKLAGQVLDKRQDVTLNKIKAFPVVSVVMGVNLLPSTADYCWLLVKWSNKGIQKVMTKNRFSQFFQLNDSATEPRRGENDYDHIMITLTK